ncbi:VCBS repeat-containing protein [Alteromonas sp. McT4-15]|uniref:FG-GAP repeat domain-containing protein n=1 Tax=Alteromonas sp. McT4-15 TaxID=2881256 RepID=UPI001CF812F1|nr:VCBS repeat-containing protein [Alteromonas sp. McT4-15]MCB4437542.1 VCBS repeat-containing protein [Alteromonas sp. McT4-15]
MTPSVRIGIFSIIALSLAACGGGGSDSGGPVNGGSSSVSSSTIIKNAKDYDASQLNTAARAIANAQYTGKTANAEVELELVQQVFNLLFNDSVTTVPELAEQDFSNDVNGGTIKKTYSCDQGGSVTYDGKLSSTLTGTIAMDYQNCWLSSNGVAITGSTAIVIESVSESAVKYSMYFDSLTWTNEDIPHTLSGVVSIDEGFNETNSSYHSDTSQYIAFTIGSEQYKLMGNYNISDSPNESVNHAEFDFYVGSKGKLAVEAESPEYLWPYMSVGEVVVAGDKTATLLFEQGIIRYLEDTDNDGTYDVGTFIVEAYELIRGNLADRLLVAIADMSIPPTVYAPDFYAWDTVDTTTPITVSPGYYYDSDTEDEDLSVSFRWYLNGSLVEDVTGDTFPAYRAVFNDVVEVSMVVSDSANIVESGRISITLSDAPAQVAFENLPDSVSPGEYIEFRAIVSDPDLGDNQGVPTLVSAPSGATINEDGLISWQAPSNQLFKTQHYAFAFSTGEDGAEVVKTHVSVTNYEVQELARSGVEVPKINNSMVIGDFDHDGENEVLSTDSQNRVFLLSYQNGSYNQTWMYPYIIEQGGTVKQVLSTDFDNDDYPDIIVISQHSVSVITDVDETATTLLTTDNYIHSAVLGDIDNDGDDELAYLYSSSDYGEASDIVVVDLGSPESPLFTFTAEDSYEIALGNVDSDAQLELVTNSGLVYDLESGENQWFLNSGFSTSHIAVADINGDGIEEIVGADSWSYIYVYSAQNKSQITSIENFNTCDISSGKLTEDSTPVLLVGDCQWGNIHAMKLSNNTLTSVFSVDMVDHGSSSLTLGDADNDGLNELLWGTGTTHSGEDLLVTADVTATSATIKTTATTHQLDSFNAAGWADLYPGDERAVFFVPSTGNGYDGSKVLLMENTGNYITSEEISSNWDGSRIAVTTDYNNDGAGDLFLPTAQTYDGAFAAMQLNDFSIQYEITGSYSNDVSVIKAFDFNNDGFEDAVYVDGRTLKAIDVNNQVILATYTMTQYFRDFDIVAMNGNVYVALSQGNDITQILKPTASGFSIQASADISCARLTFVNADSDAASELACYNDQNQSLVMYEVTDTSLTKTSDVSVSMDIVDMAANPVTATEQTLLVTSANDDDWEYYGTSELSEMTVEGISIWKSPALIGSARSHSLHARKSAEGSLEVMMATSRAMYWLGRVD